MFYMSSQNHENHTRPHKTTSDHKTHKTTADRTRPHQTTADRTRPHKTTPIFEARSPNTQLQARCRQPLALHLIFTESKIPSKV